MPPRFTSPRPPSAAFMANFLSSSESAVAGAVDVVPLVVVVFVVVVPEVSVELTDVDALLVYVSVVAAAVSVFADSFFLQPNASANTSAGAARRMNLRFRIS
jgi:hypothetical protein